MNRATLMGRLGADPELRQTKAGKDIATFRMVTSEKWTDAAGERKEKSTWHSIVIMNEPLARLAKEHLVKGARVYVEGQIEHREYEKDGQKRTATEILLSGPKCSIQIIDWKRDASARGDYAAPAGKAGGATPQNQYALSDEIPLGPEVRA